MALLLGPIGIADFATAGRMTLAEFRLRKLGYRMVQQERERDLHLQAFLNRAVQATEKNGKYVYPDFGSFYDEEKEREKALGRVKLSETDRRLYAVAGRLQELRERGMDV